MTRDLRWYLTSTGFYLIPGGIQMVMFPWLVAVLLAESPTRVGLAQMAGQVPMLLLILWGGLLGDRLDQRRLLIFLQLGAMLPPLLMAAMVQLGQLSYALLIVWALTIGTFAAFVQPARDALLNRVAGSDIQRVVTLAVGVQFGIQILGFGIGSLADEIGPSVLMLTQALCLGLAAFATWRIPALQPVQRPPRRSALAEIGEGLAVAWRTPEIRPAILLIMAVGFFFAGSYMVILPLFVRDVYSGSAGGIAGAFAANMLGTVTTIVWIMRRGGVRRAGRALVFGSIASIAVLSILHLELPAWGFYLVVYLWGLNGGISMTMSRAIVQEYASDAHRARILSVYSLGMMGAMPLGSLTLGWCVDTMGVRDAVLVPVYGMIVVLMVLLATTRIWHLQRRAAGSASAAEPAPTPAAGS